MTRKPTITSRQKLFAELLVYETNTLSPAECAHKAGYTKRPRQTASELRNPKVYPLVAEYIRELELERKNKFSIDKAKSLQRYSQLSHGAESKNQYSAAIQAETQRGKLEGLFVERTMNQNLNINIDKMNREELLKNITRLDEKNKPKQESSPFSK